MLAVFTESMLCDSTSALLAIGVNWPIAESMTVVGDVLTATDGFVDASVSVFGGKFGDMLVAVLFS